jgi:GDPmannose 4,6-dehydratase
VVSGQPGVTTALITGVTGQDGVYLARLLREKGYSVVGTSRPGGSDLDRLRPYLTDLEVVEVDSCDASAIAGLLEQVQPDEIYNLAAFSSVGASWAAAELVAETNAIAVLRLLEALLRYRDAHGAAPRLYHASSSEIFGLATEHPQTVSTPHHPRSPYAAAKSYAHHLVVNYRESYGLFACSGILYNHESPIRPAQFVTRKITRAAAEIALGRRTSVQLGNLDVRRDWGAAQDYVRAMWLMLQQPEPADFIVATGESRTLSELLEVAFAATGLQSPWDYVEQDPALIRRTDVTDLRGDPTLAHELLGWRPQISFVELIGQMARADLARVETGVEEDPRYLDLALTHT